MLVVTLPSRTYPFGSNSTLNNTVSNLTRQCAAKQLWYYCLTCCVLLALSGQQINDYVAGYHDGALLFGKVLRERMLSQKRQRNRQYEDVPLSYNPFGNASFHGACIQFKTTAMTVKG